MRFLLAALVLALFAIAAQAGWSVNPNITGSVMMGVAFVNPSVGYLNLGQNGAGFDIYKTTDGGNTFNALNIANNTLMLLALAAQSETNAAATGLGILSSPTQVTFDGENFAHANEKINGMATSQSIRATTNGYAAAGMFGSTNGLSVSNDMGHTWQHIDVHYTSQVASPMDGAVLDEDNMIVVLGGFPSNNNNDPNPPNVRAITAHLHLDMDATKFVRVAPGVRDDTNGSWAAVVRRTNDGGKTWQTVFNSTTVCSQFLDCPSADVCYLVTYNDDGAFVLKSTDAGYTWNTVGVFNGVSSMGITCFSEDFCRVAGGASNELAGLMIETRNGGDLWTTTTVPGYMFLSWSWVSPDAGFATAIDAYQQSDFLIYTA